MSCNISLIKVFICDLASQEILHRSLKLSFCITEVVVRFVKSTSSNISINVVQVLWIKALILRVAMNQYELFVYGLAGFSHNNTDLCSLFGSNQPYQQKTGQELKYNVALFMMFLHYVDNALPSRLS